ncbi:TorF family putative porin [Altererythrobacter arenosus]|uniref:TorF family putative porin n=1 Tax=Altererythrobacter arenosus TaxID=3032592 RepID=A0ABY8FSV8_9SPHN|nr:TorF family putative porin [Altererythrobacter sp. CAU 1644]WFL78102.1 TorF family putative porin [Altererythrobacter sp. CAU 1644]
MLTSIRGLAAATITAGFALSAAPALAEEFAPASPLIITADVSQADIAKAVEVIESEQASPLGAESGWDFSANVALVSEYRFRGVDLSGGDPAIQGGLDLAHSSGFYVGTWASTIDDDTVGYGDWELDVYAGWSGDVGPGLTFDLGGIFYLYPDAGAGDFDYWELYSSLAFDLGPAGATVGIAYAPEQDSLGGDDNLYVYTDLSVGIPNSPVTLTGHLGYTDGFLTFTDDGDAFDWSLGAEVSFGPATLGVAYVDAEGDHLPGDYKFTDAAIVATLSASF